MVELNAFYMDVNEATMGQFYQFLDGAAYVGMNTILFKRRWLMWRWRMIIQWFLSQSINSRGQVRGLSGFFGPMVGRQV